MDVLDKHVYSCDAWDAGFRAKPIQTGKHHDSDLLLSECDALFLYRTNTDYEEIASTTLFSVNGLVDKGTVIEEGIILSNSYYPNFYFNNISLLRFDRLGKLDFISISTDNMSPISDIPLREVFAIKCGMDISKSRLILVLNGYLYTSSETIYSISTDIALVDVGTIPVVERYLRTLHLNDYGLEDAVARPPYVVNKKFIYQNNTLVDLFTAGNSFIIVMNNDVTVQERDLSLAGLPGRYLMEGGSDGIFQFYTGEVCDYLVTGNEVGHIMSTSNSLDWVKRKNTTTNLEDTWVTYEPDPPFGRYYTPIKKIEMYIPSI